MVLLGTNLSNISIKAQKKAPYSMPNFPNAQQELNNNMKIQNCIFKILIRINDKFLFTMIISDQMLCMYLMYRS